MTTVTAAPTVRSGADTDRRLRIAVLVVANPYSMAQSWRVDIRGTHEDTSPFIKSTDD